MASSEAHELALLLTLKDKASRTEDDAGKVM